MKKFCIAACLLIVTAGYSQATMIQPSTLEAMIRRSDAIVIGQVGAISSYWEQKRIFTDVVISLEQVLKPVAAEQAPTLTLKIPGGTVGNVRSEFDGAPQFTINEKVLLFLIKTDEYYTPYALFYGVYTIMVNPDDSQEYVHGPLFYYDTLYDPVTGQEVPNDEWQGAQPLAVFIKALIEQIAMPQSPQIPSKMIYHGLNAFDCKLSQFSAPLVPEASPEIITGDIDGGGRFSRKSPYLSCNTLGGYILWNAQRDECFRNTQTYLYSHEKKLANQPQVITVQGFRRKEVITEGHLAYEKFYVVNIPDYAYICCHVCCNQDSPFFNQQKQCFWYKAGEEEPEH